MKCAICKNGYTQEEDTTVLLQRTVRIIPKKMA